LYQVPAPPKFQVSPQEIKKVLAPEYVSFQVAEEDVLEEFEKDGIQMNQTNSFVEDLSEVEKKHFERSAVIFCL